jgi:hypothetical protein
MMDMQILGGILVALAALVGLAVALSAAVLAASSVSKPGPAPGGGIRPDQPQYPQSDTGDARVLVLR